MTCLDLAAAPAQIPFENHAAQKKFPNVFSPDLGELGHNRLTTLNAGY